MKKKIKPEWMDIKSSLAGTGLVALERPRRSYREMQRITVGVSTTADGSLEQGRIISLQVIVEV